jgi:hypothetical protein
MSHLCVQCGDTFEFRAELELHWEAETHGPAATQQAQLDRARASVHPVESATVQRRRSFPTRIKRP